MLKNEALVHSGYGRLFDNTNLKKKSPEIQKQRV